MWVDFNINHNVRVKLTLAGIEALRKEHKEFWRGAKYATEFELPEQDADGWSKWQMWDLMNKLGKACFNGCNPPMQTAIQIELPDTSGDSQP